VKKSMKKKNNKKKRFEKIADEVEKAASKGIMKVIFDITKTLSRDRPGQVKHVKERYGKLLTKESEIKSR
jgi:hypothetical protein